MLSLRANGNVIYTITEETPNDRDYEKLVPFLQELGIHYEKLNWYFELKDVEVWIPESKWKNADFDFSNSFKIKKIALVGSEKFKDQLMALTKPFTEAEIKFFPPKEKDEAKLWID